MSEKKKTRSEQEWLDLIQECRASGLLDREWCQMHSISIKTFHNREVKRGIIQLFCERSKKMFFVRTEERVITREELLKRENWHKEYLISVICEGENEEREYISGVSIIQEKWRPEELYEFRDILKSTDIVGTLMSQASEKVDASEDLEIIRQIIEKEVVDYESDPEKEIAEGVGRDLGLLISMETVVPKQVVQKLEKLYQQEYCKLVWNGSICHMVVVNAPIFDTELGIVSGIELKRSAEEEFFDFCSDFSHRWVGVNTAFRLGMLKFPETMTVIKLREYFGAIARLVEVKYESKRILGEGVYDSEKISERFGSRLVQELHHFGDALGKNRFHQAECNLEGILRFQNEIYKITDQEIKVLVKEALEILNQNMDVLKEYFDSWDTYIGSFFCGDQSIDRISKSIISESFSLCQRLFKSISLQGDLND